MKAIRRQFVFHVFASFCISKKNLELFCYYAFLIAEPVDFQMQSSPEDLNLFLYLKHCIFLIFYDALLKTSISTLSPSNTLFFLLPVAITHVSCPVS